MSNNSINLNCYTITFRRRNKAEFLKIQDVFGTDDFKTAMEAFATRRSENAFTNNAEDRMLHFHETLTSNEKIFSGVMKRGHNGVESDIDELIDGKPNTVNNVKSNQFNSLYFYFLIALPKPNSDKLIFITQTYGQYGCKELFEASYKHYINLTYEGQYSPIMASLTIPKLFSNYIKNGDVRRLVFRKHSLTRNVENLLGENDTSNVDNYEVETSVKMKRGFFQGIKNIDFTRSSLVEVYDLGIDYDEAYADVSLNGRKRLINISNPDKFTASFDVTERVRIDAETKRPIFTSLDIEAISILNEEILFNL